MELSSRKSARFKDKLEVCSMGGEDLAEKLKKNGKLESYSDAAHAIGGKKSSDSSKMFGTNANPTKCVKRKKLANAIADDDVASTDVRPESCTEYFGIEEIVTCRHCERRFSPGQGLALLKHERRCPANNTDESEQFACDICLKYSFKTPAEWAAHRQLHFEGSRFKCPRCDKIFTAIAGVENHLPYCRGPPVQNQKSIPAAKPKCMFCQKVPSTDITLHVLSSHSQSVMILCVCGKLSMGQRLHKEHLSTCRAPVNIMYACELCDTFMSSYKDELLDHKRNYHGPQSITITNAKSLNSNQNQSVGTVNLSVSVINSLIGATSTTEVSPQNLLPSLLQLSDTSIAIPSVPELVPGPSASTAKEPRPPVSKSKLTSTTSRPPQLTQKPGTAGDRNANTSNSTKIKEPLMTSSKPSLTPPPLVKIPAKNPNNFAKCIESFEFKTNECMKCGKKFFMKAGLDLHTVQCDGKFVFKCHEYNIQEKDCAFLLALN